jgi:hypothetical protein
MNFQGYIKKLIQLDIIQHFFSSGRNQLDSTQKRQRTSLERYVRSCKRFIDHAIPLFRVLIPGHLHLHRWLFKCLLVFIMQMRSSYPSRCSAIK